ncbi:MAG: hydantoinase/oxoprolinase family protein [Nitrospinota bacterium]|nr:MAG: hydantoinase/oxoprolinase family protein [Nitrospinota bacterium]
MTQRLRLGIDIGGTFTDLSLMDEASGTILIWKTPSTPAHPAAAVVRGIQELTTQQGINPADIRYFVHGTTIATNTIIERSGAKTGLFITQGFRDILRIARLRLPNVFDLLTERAEPLVRRRYVREINERILASGRIYKPLDPEEIRREIAFLVAEGVEALAISFLHAYKNPEHEEQAKEIVLQYAPDLYVCTSTEIWPQMREYERTLVTVINAYVGKKMHQYFSTLQQQVQTTGITVPVYSTKSNGGIMTAESARQTPVETLLSGPASGVVGAAFVGKMAGFDRLITLDMGGTSADVAIVDQEVQFSTENHIGEFPVIMPVVDVNSIGAGGGSIAWTDAAGVLKVGPRSAGADPGPACYGLGGKEPTITDAYVTLGILHPQKFLGGTLPLYPDLAREAMGDIGRVLGLEPVQVAESIIRVATANMYAELITLMARKGVDPTDFSLLVYGGAGATHAFLLAKEVRIRTVVVPRYPGILCALGCLVSDVRSDFVRTFYQRVDPEKGDVLMDRLAEAYTTLDTQALQWLDREGIPVQEKRVVRSVDMRYLGQSFEINVPLEEGVLQQRDFARFAAAFHAQYQTMYGYSDDKAPLEVIDLRTTVIGTTPKPNLALESSSHRSVPGEPEPIETRQIYFEGEWLQARVYDRSLLQVGDILQGPAIVEQFDTTTFLIPGFTAQIDRLGNLIGTHTEE